MNKFSLLAILLVATAANSAYASPTKPKVAFKDGFYGALSAGIEWGHADWSGLSSISLIDDTHNTNAYFQSWTPDGDHHDGVKGIGSVALGYQLVDARLYLGGQVAYTLREKTSFNLDSSKKFSHVAENAFPFPVPSVVSGLSDTFCTVTLSNNEFDIDLKPGILLLKNFVVYARAGVAFTELKIKSSEFAVEMRSESVPPLTYTLFETSHNSKSTIGFRAGAGMEYLITEHVGIALDYVYSDYGKIKTRVQGQSPEEFNFNSLYAVFSPEVKVSTQSLMLGLVVHF